MPARRAQCCVRACLHLCALLQEPTMPCALHPCCACVRACLRTYRNRATRIASMLYMCACLCVCAFTGTAPRALHPSHLPVRCCVATRRLTVQAEQTESTNFRCVKFRLESERCAHRHGIKSGMPPACSLQQRDRRVCVCVCVCVCMCGCVCTHEA